MKSVNLKTIIYQGKQSKQTADINIIIDVLRAFSVSFYAFERHVKKIILVDSIKEALKKRKNNMHILLSGEINGLKINNFDFGNSPYEINKSDLRNNVLVQKTTNGVHVAINSLNAKHVFVTGFVNAYTLSQHVKKIVYASDKKDFLINIIASHPNGDDDLACAQYIEKLLLNDNDQIKELEEHTLQRIIDSSAAQKFLDKTNKKFHISDLLMTMSLQQSSYVMELTTNNKTIEINKWSI